MRVEGSGYRKHDVRVTRDSELVFKDSGFRNQGSRFGIYGVRGRS